MLGRHDRSPRLRTFARRLRARSTDGCVTQSAAYFFSPLPVLRGRVGVGVERRLASETPTLTLPLSTGRGNRKPPADCVTHPIGGYIVDFVCLKANLVVELDGGQHADPAGLARVSERTRRLAELGLRVLRVPDDEMLKDPDAVLTTILRELEALRPPPYPPPGYRERE